MLQIVDAAAGNAGVVFQRAYRLFRGFAQLRFKVGELRMEFLHSRMAGQKRARLQRHLCAKIDALLRNPPDQFVVRDIGDIADAALPDHVANDAGFRLRVGLRGACRRELRVDLGELLICDRRVVGADIETGFRTESFGTRLGVREPDFQVGELGRQRRCRDTRIFALGACLGVEI